jgi:hypothetical protein
MSEQISILNASLMAGEGVINGFTEAVKKVFTGGYYTLNPSHPSFNEELLRLTLLNRPTIIFLQIQTSGILRPEIAKEIAKHSFVIQFSGDIRHDTEAFYYEIGKEIQLTTFSNMRDVNNCRKLGIRSEWLEIGFDPERFKSWEVPLKYDVVAHFNDYGETKFPLSGYRLKIAERLKHEFGDRFAVFGAFPGAKGNFNSDQVEESKNYCASKVAINCSHFFCDKYSSDRMLRILGSGVACVSHHFPQIDAMYTPGVDLLTFTDLDDMVIACKLLIHYDMIRENIARNGQQKALNNFTFYHMAQNIKNLYLNYEQ